ncbi:hypothetical protein BB561_004935 [Smittium simulii]|uniref:Uncharacterized protein n=1 Tax=Smittium simulii TaxID=133385 RepID=A0A2T9YDA4_9FUNG|nr:hypothetical protein BB561_004935 [Smittium simulii]
MKALILMQELLKSSANTKVYIRLNIRLNNQSQYHSIFHHRERGYSIEAKKSRSTFQKNLKKYSLQLKNDSYKLCEYVYTKPQITHSNLNDQENFYNFSEIKDFYMNPQNYTFAQLVDEYIQNANSILETIDNINTKIFQKSGTTFSQNIKSISNHKNDLKTLTDFILGKTNITEDQLFLILFRIKNQKIISDLSSYSIYALQDQLIYSLKRKEVESRKKLIIIISNFLTLNILESKYYFTSTKGYNKMIGILSLLDHLELALNLKNALRIGIFGSKLTANTETYESILYYSKFSKIEHYNNPSIFGKFFLENFDIRLSRQTKLPDPSLVIDSTRFSWVYLLFSEIVNRNIELSSSLEILLIGAACRNQDFILLHTLLQKTQGSIFFDSNSTKFFNYIKYLKKNSDFFKVLRFQNKIWNMLNIYSRIRLNLIKMETSRIQKISYKQQDMRTIDELSYIHEQVKLWNSKFSDFKIKKLITNDDFQYSAKKSYNARLTQYDPSVNYYNFTENLQNRYNFRLYNRILLRHTYYESYWDSFTYYVMSLIKNRKWKRAFVVFVEFRYKLHKPPSIKLYYTLIKSLAYRKEIFLANELVLMMKSDQVEMTKYVFESLVIGCMESNKKKIVASSVHRIETQLNRSHSIYFNGSIITKRFLEYIKWNTYQNSNIDQFILKNQPNNINRTDLTFTNLDSINFATTDSDNKYNTDQPFETSIHNVNLADKRDLNINQKSQSKKFYKLQDLLTEKNSFDWDDRSIFFPNNAIYFYIEIKKLRDISRSRNNVISSFSLNTVNSIVCAIATASDQNIISLSKVIDTKILSLAKNYSLAKSNVFILRHLAVIELYYSEIDYNLKNSCLLNNRKLFLESREFNNLFILPALSLNTLELYEEFEDISKAALKFGIVL